MTRRRSILAGMTDYTGVALADIVEHIRQWHDMTRDALTKLGTLRAGVEQAAARLESPEEVVSYIEHFGDLFERYRGDFQRLIEEIPRGVREAHVEIVTQIYQSSEHEDNICVEFKRRHISRELPDESVRPLVDDIYSETRSILISYRDLSNVVPRLRTFVGAPATGSAHEVLQLKPAFWGIGIDLRQGAREVREWWRKRKTGKGRTQ